MNRTHALVWLTALGMSACVPTFDGERPRELRVDGVDDDAGVDRDAGRVRNPIDAGFVDAGMVPGRDAGFGRDAGPRDGGPPPYAGPTWEDDIQVIMAASCQGCHSDPVRFGAPMPLVTYADMTAPAPSDPTRTVYELVAYRMVPMPGIRIMPPAGALPMDQVQTVVTWALEGAPEGPKP